MNIFILFVQRGWIKINHKNGIIQKDISIRLLQENRDKVFINFQKDFEFDEDNLFNLKHEFLEILEKSENTEEYYEKLTLFYKTFFKDKGNAESR